MRAGVLWTGGKDSALAWFESRHTCNPVLLVTFAPRNASFRGHPLELMALQATAMGLPHRIVHLDSPYPTAYENAIAGLRSEVIECLVTGDIDLIDGQSNWVYERAQPSGMKVLTRLWRRPRDSLLRSVVDGGFSVVLSLARAPHFDPSWVGRRLDTTMVAELVELGRRTGVDACGESGEYHTMTLDAPGFA